MDNDTQPEINPFAAQQRILRERLQFFLVTLPPIIRADVMYVLEGQGKLLSQSPQRTNLSPSSRIEGVWPLLTLLIAQNVSSETVSIAASNVAISIECFICALDLLDDVEDEDQTLILQTLGVARTLNVSTILLTLAQQAILSLSEQNISPVLILRLLTTLQESTLLAAIGQHRDLLAEQRSLLDLTNEECIEIAAGKAGALMRLACRMGAICAGANDFLCDQFSNLGELLGISHQLDNDCHDLYYLLQRRNSSFSFDGSEKSSGDVKSDLVRGKKTLPVVIAARRESSLQETVLSADNLKQEHVQALHDGIIATWGICLLYRERASSLFGDIESQIPIAPSLRLLLGLS
jgi:geranylgeranyl pyrophosphate synthase